MFDGVGTTGGHVTSQLEDSLKTQVETCQAAGKTCHGHKRACQIRQIDSDPTTFTIPSHTHAFPRYLVLACISRLDRPRAAPGLIRPSL